MNPELSKKHPSYVDRVSWVGDISRSYAAFRLVNIRLSDSKTYGCQLGVGGFGQTKDSKMSLRVVEVRDVFKKRYFLSLSTYYEIFQVCESEFMRKQLY